MKAVWRCIGAMSMRLNGGVNGKLMVSPDGGAHGGDCVAKYCLGACSYRLLLRNEQDAFVGLQEHPVFSRRGANLFMKKNITLFEALTGYKFVIEHLDGRKLLVESKPHEVTSSGGTKVIRQEGMPVYKNPFEKGHLFIEFVVAMPTPAEMSLDGQALKNHLKKVLPQPPPLKIRPEQDHEFEHFVADDVRPEDLRSRADGGRSEAYDEDDDEGSGRAGAHRVQCNQQ